MNCLKKDFFIRDVLDIAPDLIGKILVRRFEDGKIKKYIITETEAYRGEEDLACHASKGRTKRTDVMYQNGGIIYVYLIYGMYWMLNFVCENENIPQAVLIRGIKNFNGPGKVGKELKLNREFNYKEIILDNNLCIIDNNIKVNIITKPRVGIDYAGKIWKNKPWRFILAE
ncbi:MAG: DNA-3-methyladenine glycosylase [Bacteroidetes bacterium]|nr:MAG: DNA-3-methyladenine glycosylase [Bacteroidota bacterium]